MKQFQGRISRETFRLKFSIFLIFLGILTFIIIKLGEQGKYEEEFNFGEMIIGFSITLSLIYCLYKMLGYFSQRIHDFDFSLWHSLLLLILLIFPPLFFIVICALGFILYFVKGNPGKNKFGNDPYGISSEFIHDTLPNTVTKVFKSTSLSASEVISKKIESVSKQANISFTTANITNHNWTLLNESPYKEVTYIFRKNNELLISRDGSIKRCKYEFVIDNNSILISNEKETVIYKIVVSRDDFFILNRYSTEQILFFANRTKFEKFIKNEILKEAKKYAP